MQILKLSPSKIHKIYHVYIVLNKDNEIIYIGASKLYDVINLRDLVKFESFDTTQEYVIRIESSHPSKFAAQNAQFLKQKELNIVTKYNSFVSVMNQKSVKCNETGVVYKTAAEACKALDIEPSRMSCHLRDLQGHKSIKGFTFSMVKYEV